MTLQLRQFSELIFCSSWEPAAPVAYILYFGSRVVFLCVFFKMWLPSNWDSCCTWLCHCAVTNTLSEHAKYRRPLMESAYSCCLRGGGWLDGHISVFMYEHIIIPAVLLFAASTRRNRFHCHVAWLLCAASPETAETQWEILSGKKTWAEHHELNHQDWKTEITAKHNPPPSHPVRLPWQQVTWSPW